MNIFLFLLSASALCLTSQQHVYGFTITSVSISTHQSTTIGSRTELFMAVKKGNKKKKATSLSNNNKKAAGFGGASSSNNSSSGGSSSPSLSVSSAQVRSVTGHTGSGTKPLRQAANTFDALRKEFGVDACRDVYVRAPLNDARTFWFVGKIAVRLGEDPHGGVTATPEMAIWSQKRLILEYAKHQLRPQNLGGKYSKDLELWLAPGDSEMDAVQNKIHLQKVEGSANDLPEGFVVRDTVGYNPEIYVGDEVTKGGLRVHRDPETGAPIKPVFEVNESA